MVVPWCFPEASSAPASSAKTTESAEIVLSDPALRAKSEADVGWSRRKPTKKIMTWGGHYGILRLGRSIHVFGDGDGIGMVIGSDFQEGSEAMAEASILII